MKTRRSRINPWATGLSIWLLSSVMAGAASSEESFAYDLAAELMSPFCPGRTVASCPSPQASELIQWIQVQEAAGASEEEVVEMLIDRFGEDILGAPPAEGITLWAYVFPIVGFLGGGGVAAMVLRRIVGRRDAVSADFQSVSGAALEETGEGRGAMDEDELARLVDEELSSRR